MIRRAILARIHSIRQTVLAIVQGDLSHRLPSRSSGDELETLSHTINGMLDQIEQLINGIRDVSNSIAHDLRTPLAELRSRLEELSLTRPTNEETFAEIDGAVADVDRVIRIFNALLRLAEIDTGMRRSGFVQVNANELAAEVVEFYSPAAEVKEVTLSFALERPRAGVRRPHAAGAGRRQPDRQRAQVRRRAGLRDSRGFSISPDGAVEICVADDGPGIPDTEKPKVAQRFYRGDASRGTPGVGLGLSLVQAVAKLHGGTLELTDNFPGLRARMMIEPGALLSGRPRVLTSEPEERRGRSEVRAERHGALIGLGMRPTRTPFQQSLRGISDRHRRYRRGRDHTADDFRERRQFRSHQHVYRRGRHRRLVRRIGARVDWRPC